MLTIQKKVFRVTGFALAALLAFQSCNKSLEPIAATPTTPPASNKTILDIINSDASYSILKAAITKAGANISTPLGNAAGQFTFFAPDNAAFNVAGIPSEAALALFRAGQLDTLLRYHIIPGKVLTSASVSTAFPNMQMPTNFVLSAPFFRMSLFPSKPGGTYPLWINNLPVVAADIAASNGVIHKPLALVSPPSQVLAQIAAADTSLSFFMTAVARADSGETVDLKKFTYLLAYPPTNFTVFAPNNNAFREMLVAMGLPPSAAVINALPVATVKGLLAYHILGTRAFTNNFPATATAVPTLAVPAPGITLSVKVQSIAGGFSGLVTDNKGITANILSSNKHAINGVMHIIDKVLQPI